MWIFFRYFLFITVLTGIFQLYPENILFAQPSNPEQAIQQAPLSLPAPQIIEASPETYAGHAMCPDGQTPISVRDDTICGCAGCECLICGFCSDGIVTKLLGETCDPPGSSTAEGDCTSNCTYCGDTVANNPSEECDGADFQNNFPTPAQNVGHGRCNTATCKIEYCGDGLINNVAYGVPEQCDINDYGSLNVGAEYFLKCTPTCKVERCNDNVFSPNNGEECDRTAANGNGNNQAGCNTQCRLTNPGLVITKEFRSIPSGVDWTTQSKVTTPCNAITTTTTEKHVRNNSSVEFRFKATNTGTVKLTNLRITDPAISYSSPLFDLDVGASFTVTHSLPGGFTQGLHHDDVTINDNAALPPLGVSDTEQAEFCVTGCGDGFIDTAATVPEQCDGANMGTTPGLATGCNASCQYTYNSGISLVKQAIVSGKTFEDTSAATDVTTVNQCQGSNIQTQITNSKVIKQSSSVSYQFIITNTGGRAVRLDRIDDPLLGLNNAIIPGNVSIAPGLSYTYIPAFASNPYPANSLGLLRNSGTIYGTDTSNTAVSASDSVGVCVTGCGDGFVDINATVPEQCDGANMGSAPGLATGCNASCKYTYDAFITLNKIATSSTGTIEDITGDPKVVSSAIQCQGTNIQTQITNKKVVTRNTNVNYSFVITNTGGLPVTVDRITDAQLGLNSFAINPAISIPAGQSRTYTPSPAIPYLASTLGLVRNLAKVEGEDLNGVNVEASDTVGYCVTGCGDGFKETSEACDGLDFGLAGKPANVESCSNTCNLNYLETVRVTKTIKNSGTSISSTQRDFSLPAASSAILLGENVVKGTINIRDYQPKPTIISGGKLQAVVLVEYSIQNTGPSPLDLISVVDAIIASGSSWPDLTKAPTSLPRAPLAPGQTVTFSVNDFKFIPFDNLGLHSSTAQVGVSNGFASSLPVKTEFTTIGCGNGVVDHATEQCDGNDFGTIGASKTLAQKQLENTSINGCTSINDEITNNTPNFGCKLTYKSGIRVVKRALSESKTFVNDNIVTNVTSNADCDITNILKQVTNNKIVHQSATVNYSFEIFNDGGLPVTITQINDTMLFGAGGHLLPTSPAFTILPNSSRTYTPTISFTASNLGALLNTATVLGTDSAGSSVVATSSVGVCVTGKGEAVVRKLVSKSTESNYLQRKHSILNCANVQSTSDFFITRSEKVNFRFEVKLKDGNTNPIKDLVLSDNKIGTPVYVSGDNGNNILEFGEVWIYQLLNTTLATGGHSNTVNVTAKNIDNSVVAPTTDNSSFCVIDSGPSVTVVKKVGQCPGICGNNIIEPGEECDGGVIPVGTPSTSTCSECKIVPIICGNGLMESENGESCDGNDFSTLQGVQPSTSGDSCTDVCDIYYTYCGNSIREGTEVCDALDFSLDPGVQKTTDGSICDWSCKIAPVCGDGIINGYEECDGTVVPAGTAAGVICSANCRLIPLGCGNGLRESPEYCDNRDFGLASGVQSSTNNEVCTPSCDLEIGFCGNGIRESGEACDGGDFDNIPGIQPHPKGATCNSWCELEPYCGDGIINGSEQCDGSKMPSNVAGTAYCNSTCLIVDTSTSDIIVIKKVTSNNTNTVEPVRRDITNCDRTNSLITNFITTDQYAAFSYEVKLKPGSPAVSNLVLTDAVLGNSYRFTASDPLAYSPSGDSNRNGILEQGEVWIYNAGAFMLPAGPHRNDVVVRGTSTVGGASVESSDYASFCVGTGGPRCGNGIIEAPETCDFAYKGPFGTTALDKSLQDPLNCRTYGAACTYCGDGIINGGEQCDFAGDPENCTFRCQIKSCELTEINFQGVLINYWKFKLGYQSDQSDISYKDNGSLYGMNVLAQNCVKNNSIIQNGITCDDIPEYQLWKSQMEGRISCVSQLIGSEGLNDNLYQKELYDHNSPQDSLNPNVVRSSTDYYGMTFSKQVYGNVADDLKYYQLVQQITGFSIPAFLDSAWAGGPTTYREMASNYEAFIYTYGSRISDPFINPDCELRMVYNADGTTSVDVTRPCTWGWDLAFERAYSAMTTQMSNQGINRYYLDKDCNVVSNKDVNLQELGVCGEVDITAALSPISLILNEDLTSFFVPKKFSLNPAKEKEWVVWKANANRPLLVFDPKKSGQIKDGSMLFGNFTFGGNLKTKAPWANGYEALGSLDKNNNGYLEGEELTPISLWFDENANAVSDDSEVIDARTYGLKSIKVNFDFEDDVKDLYANNGFILFKDGQEVTGRTVDWYSGSYLNEGDALREIQRLQKTSSKDSKTDDQNKVIGSASNVPLKNEISNNSTAETKSIQGLWKWVSKVDPTNNGYLSIFARNGRIAGMSIVEEKILMPSGEFVTRLKSFPLLGGSKVDPSGDIALNFAVKAGDILIVSNALISAQNGGMIADSQNQFRDQKIGYSWTAERVVKP